MGLLYAPAPGVALLEAEESPRREDLYVLDERGRVALRSDGRPWALPRDLIHALKLRHPSLDVALTTDGLCNAYKGIGEIAMQQRSSTPGRKNPGKWTLSCQGHIRAEESGLAAAVREVGEELFYGVERSPEIMLKQLFSILTDGDGDPEFKFVFGGVYAGDFSIDGIEVAAVKRFDMRYVLRRIRTNPEDYTETTINVIKEFEHRIRNRTLDEDFAKAGLTGRFL